MAKTFYLYGHGTEHTTPLAIVLKQGSTVVGTASLPHDKAEATEDVSAVVWNHQSTDRTFPSAIS